MSSCPVDESPPMQLMACSIEVRNSSVLLSYIDQVPQTVREHAGETSIPSLPDYYSTLWYQWPASDIQTGTSDPAVDAVRTLHICKSEISDHEHLLYVVQIRKLISACPHDLSDTLTTSDPHFVGPGGSNGSVDSSLHVPSILEK